ncbi:MAG: DHH family phosphoesterase [Desulfovibrio sp.]|nr:DHH family phosphoesterase [Desulfovibrio sp.]
MLSSELIPEDIELEVRGAADALVPFNRVILAAHVNLDGDALGSLGAAAWMLQSLGKEFAIYSSTGVPRYLEFVRLPGPVYTDLASIPFRPESALYLDCSEKSRLGKPLEEKMGDWPSINIDHHMAERGLGSVANLLVPRAAATCQLMAYVALALSFPLEDPLAGCLALGLMTDTGWFTHGNTSAEVLALCALVVRNGFSLEKLREQLHNNWSVGKMRLWGSLMSDVHLYCDRRLAFAAVSSEDFQRYHCSKDDLEGLVEWFRRIRDVEIAAILREETKERCKFSLRSRGNVDVHSIASSLNGGGHFNAAGGAIDLPLDEAKEVLLAYIEKSLGCAH